MLIIRVLMPWAERIIRSNEKNAVAAAENAPNTYIAWHIVERAVFLGWLVIRCFSITQLFIIL